MASIHAETHKGGRKTWRVKVTAEERAAGYPGQSFPRKSDAQLYVSQIVVRQPQAVAAATTTVEEAIQRHRGTRRASRATLAKESSLAKRLEPLNSHALVTLKTADVRALVADMLDEVSPATAAAVIRYLRAVLAQAVEDGIVAANVAIAVKVPTTIKPRLDADDVWTVTDVEAVLAALPDRHRAHVAFRAYCGPRLSEALAVTAGDVDLLRKRVHVGHRVLEEVAGVAVLRNSGKTRAADRWVPVPPNVATLLEHHVATYPAGENGLIFTTADGSAILRDVFRRRVWDPAATDAGVRPVALRNLRHTAITLMLVAGLQPLDVAARVGHSKPSLLLDTYARFLPRTDAEADPYAAMLAGLIP